MDDAVVAVRIGRACGRCEKQKIYTISNAMTDKTITAGRRVTHKPKDGKNRCGMESCTILAREGVPMPTFPGSAHEVNSSALRKELCINTSRCPDNRHRCGGLISSISPRSSDSSSPTK